MLTIGIGSDGPPGSPAPSRSRQSRCRCSYSGRPRAAAAACATASETPRIALAPSLDLFGVPSSAISAASIAGWSSTSMPARAFAISVRTFSTALSTPSPPYRAGSPSRSSSASCWPVLAPDGTIARPDSPAEVVASTSTVGRPRESSTSRAASVIRVGIGRPQT